MTAPRHPVLFQCVPNFSEGRHQDVVNALAEAVTSTPGAYLIDRSADVDHNRCVLTILGDATAIKMAVVTAARVAIDRIDLREHQGVHPRIGALDVLPVIPLRGAGRPEAIALARKIGRELAAMQLPVYFYEWAASAERRKTLPELRRGGFEAVRDVPLSGERTPDVGAARAHESAGVAIVGARAPLVAYNVNLDTPDVTIAQAIAREIRLERAARFELAGVRALGFYLAARQQAQVSMNLTQLDKTSLPEVFAYIQTAASRYGVTDMESEVIGAIPLSVLRGQSPDAIHWREFKREQILETWLDQL